MTIKKNYNQKYSQAENRRGRVWIEIVAGSGERNRCVGGGGDKGGATGLGVGGEDCNGVKGGGRRAATSLGVGEEETRGGWGSGKERRGRRVGGEEKARRSRRGERWGRRGVGETRRRDAWGRRGSDFGKNQEN
ncbi:hypothetical protein E2542_SST22602 [Spatholobus suberectus]|nr:hypothetical protein E2542_SST22602 [Spatholobus suberectus]